MSVIRKIKVKDKNGNFDDKDLGALAENILIKQDSFDNLASKLEDIDEKINEVDDLSSNLRETNEVLGQLENNLLSRLMIENNEEGNLSLITQISFAELIVVNCVLNNTINIPNIIIPFEGINKSYLNCFSYFEDEIKYDIYYTISIEIYETYFVISATVDNVIQTDFSESPVVLTKLDMSDNEYQIIVESFKVLKIGDNT